MKFNNPSELISQEDLEKINISQEDLKKINNSIIGKPFTIKFNKRCSTIAAFIEDECDNVCENCLFHEFCKKNSFNELSININCIYDERYDKKSVVYKRL